MRTNGECAGHRGPGHRPDGRTVYVGTFLVRHNKPADQGWRVRAIDLATGQISLVHIFPGTQGTPAAVTTDPTGRYLLVDYLTPVGYNTRLARLDLKTGRLSHLNTTWAIEAAIAL
jgi:hypothetical protein